MRGLCRCLLRDSIVCKRLKNGLRLMREHPVAKTFSEVAIVVEVTWFQLCAIAGA